MTIEEYFGESTGGWPETGVVGVESPWMDFDMELPVPNGRLWAGDPWQVDEECLTVDVVPGVYRVQIKGMDFKGHRRVARVRACLKSAGRMTRDKGCGETGTDIGIVGLCDVVTFNKHVREDEKRLERYGEDLDAVMQAEGAGAIQFDYGKGKRVDGLMVTMPSGLGDGAFAVYPLRKGKRVVGIEVEFLRPKFKLERDIPRLGAKE